MVRAYFMSDRRANCFSPLDARNEHVFGVTGRDCKWATCPETNRAFRKTSGFGGPRGHTGRNQYLAFGKKSCSTGISTGSILKDELRVANVWTKWACNDMANASSSQAVCWRVSRKAQAVLFLTCQHKSYLRREKELNKGHVYHSGLLLYTW